MAPRSAARNQAIREETRAKIVEHALRLFAQYGYTQTSVRMIAESAGIAQGLLYRYFESKDDLLRAIFEDTMKDVGGSFAAAEVAAEPQERIERLVRASFAILREHLDFWRLSYSVRLQPRVVHDLGENLRDWTSSIQNTLERYLRDADFADPAAEAAILFALIDGVAQHYAMDPEHYPIQAVTETIITKYRRPESPRSRTPSTSPSRRSR